jgi:hypothetical protein
VVELFIMFAAIIPPSVTRGDLKAPGILTIYPGA